MLRTKLPIFARLNYS